MELNNHPILVPDNCKGLFIRTVFDPNAWEINDFVAYSGERDKTIDGVRVTLDIENRLCIVSGTLSSLICGFVDEGLILTIDALNSKGGNVVTLHRSGRSARIETPQSDAQRYAYDQYAKLDPIETPLDIGA